MASTDLNFADLDDLADLIKDGGVRSVSIDPAELNLPGVFIEVTGLEHNLLGGLTIQTRLICLVADDKPRQVLEQLQTLVNKVVPVAQSLGGPTGTSIFGTWVLPGSSAGLPGIAVPLDLLTTQESA